MRKKAKQIQKELESIYRRITPLIRADLELSQEASGHVSKAWKAIKKIVEKLENQS